MVVLLRSTDGNPDSRFEKYVNFLSSEGIAFLTCCWDRNGVKQDTPRQMFYHGSAKYGEGMKNIWKLFKFNIFLLRTLCKRRSEYEVIHAADLDTVLPAVCMKLLFGKRVIYDIYDWYIDSRCVKNKFAVGIIKLLERISIKISDVVIICEPERERQIIYKPKKLWILPNIPNIDSGVSFKSADNPVLTISYVGVLGYERGLEKLIRYAKEHTCIRLEIAGFGPLEHLLEDAGYSNIRYHGTVKYEDGLKIMGSSDLIYAVYEKTNPNHILAAPNKYYEGLFLGKPIITTEGTIVGEKTSEYKTGFCIEEDYQDLQRLLENISPEMISEYSANASSLWKKNYSTYTQSFLKGNYLPYIISA